MKRFIQTIQNIFSIEELRTRIFYTLGFLVVFRLGSFIVLPGVDPKQVGQSEVTGILGVINTFSGGAFSNVSVLGLGIMPYITASIVIQLLGFAWPYMQKLQKEGDSGRKKVNNYTRILTVVVATAQSVGYLATYVKPEMILSGMDGSAYMITRIATLVSGTMFCLWLGEKITDKGIGNGISMLIMVGIISRLPQAILSEALTRELKGALPFIIELVAFFFIIMGVVAITQAVRRIPVQYAKQIIGNQTVGGQRQYLPLKVIGAGVMPIIFAQSVMFLPSLIASLFPENENVASITMAFGDFTSWQYNVATAVLIILFTFFYTAISINPRQIAEDMRRNGGFIPGIKPGEATSEYIDQVLSKITLPGALFLAVIASMPAFAYIAGVQRDFAYFFGGTSLLILVGVVLDTLQQVESYLLVRQYDGMMKTGRIKGRTQETAAMV
ncbi:MAG TPA: preprotein translocase subunit SecY [Cytophagaceae bacterium]|jgi:preprotein translocase subunit SecY|nr:preprotein translocase subunit SecY [Cytophagaceae bacterium]